jgi:Ca-activated chloride channel homolog
MKRRWPFRTLGIAGVVSLIPLLLALQQQKDFTIRSDVRLVLLDVAVKDNHGKLITGLSREAFSVEENGKPQPVTVFASEDAPVTVGILVDESQSMTPKRNEVLNAAQSFIEKSNPEDEVFVLNFNDSVSAGLPPPTLFSGDISELRAALFRGSPAGQTALNDAIVAGLKQLEMGRRDRKTLVVISDGGDNASQHKRADMLDMVTKSLSTIYTIGIYDPDDYDRDPHLLRMLAGVSGGEALFPKSPSEMGAACTEIAGEIRSRYTIGYVPQDSKTALRHIHVRVTAPNGGKLTAHTRTSYRYEEIPKSY